MEIENKQSVFTKYFQNFQNFKNLMLKDFSSKEYVEFCNIYLRQ